MHSLIRSLFFYIALAFPLSAVAAPDWSFCSVPAITKQVNTQLDPSITSITADQLFSENKNYFKFSGNVQINRGSQQLRSEQIELDKVADVLTTNEQASFSDQFFNMNAQKIKLHNASNTGIFDLANFQIYESHLRGSAKQILQLNASRHDLYEVSYTTCDPDSNAWSLDSSKLSFNQLDGRGTALHAVFRVSDIPVFYFPWFQFPIDQRRMSGLLAPTLSYSVIDGTQLSLPFYWNMAENYDMTLTPVWYSNRGIQLNTENRYLFKNNAGQLNLSLLDDRIVDEERWYLRSEHEADIFAGLHASLLIQRVSDDTFLEDFKHIDTIEADTDFLKSSVSLSGQFASWSTQLLFEQYQTVNEDKSVVSRPYKRLPQLTLNRLFSSTDHALTIDWNNEWVRFDKEDSITGDRLHIAPIISYPMEDSYYFIKPELQLDHTRYTLDNNTDDMNSLERSLPLFSLDSGLIFERIAHNEKNWVQTLEPRLYFLYVPFEEQSDIPDFDSALLTESYQNLFINNRFSGVDRIGDTRQVSVGITTRLLNDKNLEFFSASIGQSYYATDRRVSLDNTIDERNKSSLMTQINYKPNPDWNIQLSSVYDQLEKESAQTDISIRRQTKDQVFNLEYHLRSEQLEQTTVSLVYPVSVNWTVFAKQQNSLIHDRPVQNLIGMAYESCCWGFKLLYEEESDKEFEETDRTILFQFTFKGLSSAGKDINSVLEDGILGYQPVF